MNLVVYVYEYVCMYICMNVHAITIILERKEEDTMYLRERAGSGIWENLERGNERKKYCKKIIIPK